MYDYSLFLSFSLETYVNLGHIVCAFLRKMKQNSVSAGSSGGATSGALSTGGAFLVRFARLTSAGKSAGFVTD